MRTGLDVIGMIKRNPKRQYWYQGKKYTVDRLIAFRNKNKKSSHILGSIHVAMTAGTPAKIVFIRHRSKPNKWLAILSTDQSLSDEEIIRYYGHRWNVMLISA